uniref:GOLD domain-containing protein n=1 Tax=Parascaris univalens TaxID=6257 RepID=A0A915BH89_PARUN
PQSCGGKLCSDLLRRGGEVPEFVKNQVKRLHYGPDELVKLRVSARGEERIPFVVDKKGSKLSWYFVCASGDIDFSIVFQDREVIFPLILNVFINFFASLAYIYITRINCNKTE